MQRKHPEEFALMEYLDDCLPKKESGEIKKHLKTCSKCNKKILNYGKDSLLLMIFSLEAHFEDQLHCEKRYEKNWKRRQQIRLSIRSAKKIIREL